MPSNSKSIAAIASSKKQPPPRKPPQSSWDTVKSALARMPDFEAALEAGEKFLISLWTRENGIKYETLKRLVADAAARFKHSSKTLQKLQGKVENTRHYVPSATIHGTTSPEDGNKIKWDTKDVIVLCVTLIGAVVAMALGSANVYASLVSSGNAIFIEKPWLAVTLSMLLPIGSLSIKFVTDFIDYDSYKRMYTAFVYALTFFLVLYWSYLFAQSFKGATGEIDLGALMTGGDSGYGSMLVWAQLMIEMLAGSALCLAAERVYQKYVPNRYIENLHYLDAERKRYKHLAGHNTLRDELAELEGKLAAIEADRDAFVNQHLAELIAYRELINAANDPSY